VKSLAKNSALSTKIVGNSIKIVEDFSFENPKTKEYLKLLQAFGLENKKSLLILPDLNDNIYLSGRNIQGVSIAVADSLNTYEIMNNNVILISEKSVQAIANSQN